MHRVKCPICGIYFNADKEENVQYKHRYYHKVCFDTIAKDEKDKADLEEYIVNLYNYKSPGPVINTQIKKYHDELGFTYSGIKKSLVYFYEVKGNKVEGNAVGIGIVPYIYKEAREYYYNLYLIQQNNQDKEIINNQEKIVCIERPQRKPLHKRKKIIIEEGESD